MRLKMLKHPSAFTRSNRILIAAQCCGEAFTSWLTFLWTMVTTNHPADLFRFELLNYALLSVLVHQTTADLEQISHLTILGALAMKCLDNRFGPLAWIVDDLVVEFCQFNL
jgi:hypothetical protein